MQFAAVPALAVCSGAAVLSRSGVERLLVFESGARQAA